MEKTKEEHVMISYQHKDKATATEIANSLKSAGIKVWIDSDKMASETDIVDGMAGAVEHAFAVCVLYSEAYKDSENTQREAKYAYQMKKPMLFLRAQRDYKPDGWLGFMIGTQLYIDFSGKYPFEQKFEELLKSLKNIQQSENKSAEPAADAQPTQPDAQPTQPAKSSEASDKSHSSTGPLDFLTNVLPGDASAAPAPRSRSPSPDHRGPVGQLKRFAGHIKSKHF